MSTLNRNIKLTDYLAFLEDHMGVDTVKKMVHLLDTHLLCSQCKEILHMDEFSNCSVNVNRQGKYTLCRNCVRSNYVELRSRRK